MFVKIDKEPAFSEVLQLRHPSPKKFFELVAALIKQYQQNGSTIIEAKRKAYTLAKDVIESDQFLFGEIPETKFIRWRLIHSLREIEAGVEDTLEKVVCGVRLADLDLDSVKGLFLDQEEYTEIARALEHWGFVFGSFNELREMVVWLKQSSGNALS